MSHVVEVDQSGRIEETNRDTVLAFANGRSYSILVPSAVKRECVRQLRAAGKSPKQFYLKMFVAGLFILFRNHIKDINTIVIDLEYQGLQGTIRGILLNYLRTVVPDFPKDAIVFRSIGKRSPAHYKAFGTYLRKQKPDYVVGEKELMELSVK
jgi:hypothetical protein